MRALRLDALAAAPEAFASTFAREAAFADQVWHDRAAAGAKGGSQTTLIAEEAGRWVGLATGLAAGVADNPRPMLVGMFVAAEARRRGTGVALVEGVADWVRSKGARCLVLWVRDNNAAAIALYRKCGFRATGLRRAVALAPALAEIEMLRELSSGARSGEVSSMPFAAGQDGEPSHRHLAMIDHLVYGVPDLAQGIDRLERQTGVRARLGGRHPGRGTHNALLSLGPRQYLEVIALDPDQAEAPGLLFPELRKLRTAAFIAWAVAVAEIDEAGEAIRAARLPRIGPLEGLRAREDGSLLRWKTLRFATDIPLVPFFIAWDEQTVHPSVDSPSGCRLMSVQIRHTDPEGLRRLLGEDAGMVHIAAGPRSRLTARLATPNGEVELG